MILAKQSFLLVLQDYKLKRQKIKGIDNLSAYALSQLDFDEAKKIGSSTACSESITKFHGTKQ